MQGAIRGTQTMLRGLRDACSLAPVMTELAPWHERQRLVGKPHFDELERQYGTDSS